MSALALLDNDMRFTISIQRRARKRNLRRRPVAMKEKLEISLCKQSASSSVCAAGMIVPGGLHGGA